MPIESSASPKIRRLWIATILFAGLAGVPVHAHALDLETNLVREYQAPKGFSLQGFLARGAGSQTAIAGNYSPPGEQSGPAACYIIVADNSGASGFPVRYQSTATNCAGLTPRGDGGFFLRGIRDTGDSSSTPGGFTMRLTPDGDIRWTADDTTVANAEDFRGMYAQPAAPMAYNPRSEYLMTFTIGNLSIGGQERSVTHGSTLRNDSGAFQTKAIRLGASQGFGVVGGVEPLSDSGDFVLYIADPATDGAEFLTYDGRQSVDQFKPRGDTWSQRRVIQMKVGPDGLIYILWLDTDSETQTTKVTAVSTSGAEIWSGVYPLRVTANCESEPLGAPTGMWVGSDNAVVFHNSGHLRVIDSGSGEARGAVQLADATGENVQPVDILKDADGNLKLLAVNTSGSQPTFRELSMSFSESAGSSADAGLLPDGGCPSMDGGTSSGDTRDVPSRDDVVGCGCRSASSPPGIPALVLVVGLGAVLVGRKRR